MDQQTFPFSDDDSSLPSPTYSTKSESDDPSILSRFVKGHERYRQIQDEIIQNIDAGITGYIWFFDVSIDTFSQLQDPRSPRTKKLKYHYNFDELKLRVRMLNTPHEDLASQLKSIIND